MPAARFLGLFAIAAAACGSEPEAVDAGPRDGGGGADAAVGARVCDPDRPMPAEPTTAGELEGDWAVTWTCIDGCPLRRPGLTYSPQLRVTGTALHFSNERCPDCQADVTAAITIDGCLDVTGWADFDSQCRFSYRICEMEGELNGTVTWKEPGVSEQVWQLHGVRPQ